MRLIAFGTRKIIENFEKYGVPVDALFATGGISQKNPMMMQIYADVTRCPIKIAGSENGSALGAAVFGALAAGSECGGYDSIFDATRVMANLKDLTYVPNEENALVYDKLYAEFDHLHDLFGRGANDMMKRLKMIKKDAVAK